MEERGQLQFGEYRLDPTDERLWRGDRALRLPPRAFAVLRYLVEHADRLVTKDELLSALWPGAAVGDAVLAVSISELRQTLRDAARTPRFIETVHRRGYRFHGPVTRSATSSSAQNEIGREAAPPDHLVVGRDAVLTRLQASLARAGSGTRQVVFVTGEPGIGKTTVVEHFLRESGSL